MVKMINSLKKINSLEELREYTTQLECEYFNQLQNKQCSSGDYRKNRLKKIQAYIKKIDKNRGFHNKAYFTDDTIFIVNGYTAFWLHNKGYNDFVEADESLKSLCDNTIQDYRQSDLQHIEFNVKYLKELKKAKHKMVYVQALDKVFDTNYLIHVVDFLGSSLQYHQSDNPYHATFFINEMGEKCVACPIRYNDKDKLQAV